VYYTPIVAVQAVLSTVLWVLEIDQMLATHTDQVAKYRRFVCIPNSQKVA
jgi:hypothetical protein